MAHADHVLTRGAYVNIATGPVTVNVFLPTGPYRIGNKDRAEIITATTANAPTAPSPSSDPHRLGTVLENTQDQFVAVTQLAVSSGENLYARWLGQYAYPDESGNDSDLYVVTF